MIPDLTKTSVLIAVFSLAGLCAGARGAESSGFRACYTRPPYQDDNNTGKYADIVVNLGDTGRFVFSREFSHLPLWEAAGKKHFAEYCDESSFLPVSEPLFRPSFAPHAHQP